MMNDTQGNQTISSNVFANEFIFSERVRKHVRKSLQESDEGMWNALHDRELKVTAVYAENMGTEGILKYFGERAHAEDLPLLCVEHGFNDMYINGGGRFTAPEIGKKKDELCKNILEILENPKIKSVENRIQEVSTLFMKSFVDFERDRPVKGKSTSRKVTALGVAQKIVNMYYKYRFCCAPWFGDTWDFTGCDCPVDSKILKWIVQILRRSYGKASKEEIKRFQNMCWSKMSDEEYHKVQEAIRSFLTSLAQSDDGKGFEWTGLTGYDWNEVRDIIKRTGNLAFDFLFFTREIPSRAKGAKS